MATTGGVVRLLEEEPTKEERYAHALALLARLTQQPTAPHATQKSA